VVTRRQARRTSVAAFLLERGAGFLYGFATLVITVGIFRGETSISRYFSLSRSKSILQERVSELETENASLSQEILRIKESKSYARKVLRDKYHVTDDDEKIVYYAD
jgi:cell division protein FtsB